ncbi:protein of unknown function [Flaviramulus basaltis]|uniref:3-keto-alpha-glucoside-1,2-lyase/3-keto-2-hydroxy-glucal hydratase domain-containing protein n=1 Tax=Flaviramulus basaltis TaxID=369401 RepID=A0A1K2IHF2_9FLAO|nr:DUF1080 domain-containing protein [Flaviramulus basaltis]SFZ91857.1 protein of unknown function [Flaviramulus basaltis]
MKTTKITLILTLILLVCLINSCKKEIESKNTVIEYNWENLIDNNLTNWDTYLSFKHQLGYDGTAPKNENDDLIAPVGLNDSTYHVFNVIKDGEELNIKVTGEYYGALISKKEYENYHLQLKYKWGNKKWDPRKDLLKDSGILYHSIGPMGAEYWRSWMLSQEFQIMEGHTGDYWSQATSAIDIRAYTPEYKINPMANETQDYIPLGEGSPYENYCLRSNDYENLHDEWNTLDLYCFENKSLHMVNGKVVMILKNSRYLNDNGEFVPLTKGKIQIQSEAAEVFYKDIRIRTIDSLEQKLNSYF